jgi:hypothetical protein
MRRLDIDRHWFEVSMVVSGASIVVFSFLIDAIGSGDQAGFGLKQAILALLGSSMLVVAGVMLRARGRGWDPKIPTVAEISAYVRRQWRDILLVTILAIAAAFLSYGGARLINPVVYDRRTDDVWFQADIARFLAVATRSDAWEHIRTKVHPLFSLLAYSSVSILREIDLEPITAIRVMIAAVAALWISTLFVLLRLIGCPRFDAMLFSALAATSATAVFGFVIPDTYAFGSLSILLALVIVVVAQRKTVSPLWYVFVSALTLGMTVTNWMAGILATLVNHRWKRTLQITVIAFCLVVILWGVEKSIFPWASFFLYVSDSERVHFLLAPVSGGPLHTIKSFVFHTMVMPSIAVVNYYRRPYWPVMATQPTLPGSGSLWGGVAVGLWIILLGLGLWALFSIKQHRRLRIVLGLLLLGQLVLHIIYGEETFLYSLHFGPLLVILAALSTLTRKRRVVLVLVVALLVSAGINNGLQFARATEFVQCLSLNEPQTSNTYVMPPISEVLADTSSFKEFSTVEQLLPTCNHYSNSTK